MIIQGSVLNVFTSILSKKTILDELFSYFLADSSSEKALAFEVFDVQTLLDQLTSEYSDFLESAGFMTEVKFNIDENFTINRVKDFEPNYLFP